MRQGSLSPAPSPVVHARRTVVWTAFVSSLLVTALICLVAWDQQRRSDRERFEAQADQVIAAVDRTLSLYESALKGAAALLATRPVSSGVWRSYAASLERENALPGVQEIGFARSIAPLHPLPVVEPARENETERSEVPASSEAMTNSLALSFMMLGQDDTKNPHFNGRVAPVYRFALQQAKETRHASRSILAMLPAMPVSLQDNGRQNPAGYVYVRFAAEEIMKAALARTAPSLQARLFDGEQADAGSIASRSEPAPLSGPVPHIEFKKTVRLALDGRPWTLEIAGVGNRPADAAAQHLSFYVLGAAILFSLSLFGIVCTSIRRRGIARLPTEADDAMRSMNDIWYERAQSIARFGSYQICIAAGTMRQSNRWSQEMYRILERDPGQGPMSTMEYLEQYVHPEDRDDMRSILERAMTDDDAAACEYRVVLSDGKIKYVYDFLEYASSNGGSKVFLGQMHDISECKLNELERLASAAKFQAFVEELGGIPYVAILDDQGSPISVGKKIEALLGFSSEQWCNDPTLRVRQLHDEDRRRVLDAISDTVLNGKPFSIDYRIRRSDGLLRWLHDEARVVANAAGEPLFMQGVMLDLTERKRMQEELERSHGELKKLIVTLDSLREEEQKRLAQEMHDDLGQLLAAIKMDLHDFQQSVPRHDLKTLRRLDNINDLVSAMVVSVRRIIADLPPKVLADLGLFDALALMTESFEKRHQLPCRLKLPRSEPEINQKAATAIYRIVQESLNNIAKHADATNVDVQLTVHGERIVLCVADNGKGAPPNAFQKTGSFGLICMRERVASLDGEIRLESVEGTGTIVRIMVPISMDHVVDSSS